MKQPLFEGTKDLVRRFRSERRAKASLTAEQFLDAQPAGAHDPAGIAREQWIELLDVARNPPDAELDALVREWLDRQAGAATRPLPLAATLPLEDAPGAGPVPADESATLRTPAPPPAEDAAVIDRRYRIVRVLGEGAFGKVFLVQDKLQNDAELALKLIKKEHTATSEALMRFKNEILLLRVLNHPGIPQIFNDGLTEDGEFYYTMAYVSGRTLDDVIRKEAPLDPLRIVRITKQVLDVLEYAHSRGAIHRDLKPGNIFLLHAGTPKEQVRVLDFGIAKVLSREGMLEHAQTMHTEMPLGTPHYMSPEQVRGTEVDGRTDLYALGVILYQMCSGRFPFSGKTLMEILAARLEKPPNPLEDATTPEWLRQLVMKLLEREREHRPDTQAIRAMLDRLQGTQRTMSRQLAWIATALVVLAGAGVWFAFGARGKAGSDADPQLSRAPDPAPGPAPGPASGGGERAGDGAGGEPPRIAPDVTGGERANAQDGDRPQDPPPVPPAAQLDSDGDGTPDARDDCPKDPAKQAPGLCGCGVPDVDADGDGTPDCLDLCKDDPRKTRPGACGCGVPDDDGDGDGRPDCVDAFPQDATRWLPEEPVPSGGGSARAPKLLSGFVAADGATLDAEDRPSAIVHERTGIRLELVAGAEPGFYLGRTEVTREQWARGPLAASVALADAPPGDGAGSHPAAGMTWEDAREFAERQGLRLPSTAEWERAAALAGGRAFPWGDAFVAGGCNSKDPGDAFPKTAPVASFEQDRCGPFHDLAGNVQEWCVAGDKPALRGGGWNSSGNSCKLTSPVTAPSRGAGHIGFRVALSTP